MPNKLSQNLNSHLPDNWDVTIALRYLPIVDDLKRVPPGTILEVGPGEFGILPYLPPTTTITGVDVDFGRKSQKRMRMVGLSGRKLPFKDREFDTVICVDTLEHMDEATRRQAIAEMVRVCRSRLYLGFPSGWAARFADRLLARYYRLTHRTSLPFLTEHRRFVLPRTGRMAGYLNEAMDHTSRNGQIRVFGNTNFLVWIALLLLGFSQVGPLTSVYRWLALAVRPLAYLNLPPYYRSMIFIDFTTPKI